MSSSPFNQEHVHDDLDSLQSLIARARQGDTAAAGLLVDRYRNYLMLIANQEVAGSLRTKQGASDLVQESMIHAQTHIAGFGGSSEAELKAWLKKILINDIRKGHRHFATDKRNVNLEVNIQEQSAVGRGLIDGQMTPSSEAIEKEKQAALSDAMATLSDEQQNIIRLRNFSRLSFAEIGKQMDRSEDAARKLWARSIEALKQRLRQFAPEFLDDHDHDHQ